MKISGVTQKLEHKHQYQEVGPIKDGTLFYIFHTSKSFPDIHSSFLLTLQPFVCHLPLIVKHTQTFLLNFILPFV